MVTAVATDFSKVVCPGRIAVEDGVTGQRPGKPVYVYCTIAYKEGRLSITGVEGPYTNGNCWGGCGQIDMSINPDGYITRYAPGWDQATFEAFLAVWGRWHFNDMRAGTPAQDEALRPVRDTFNRLRWCDEACAYLESVGLLVDDGYRYGSAWLREDVPDGVLDFLRGLPNSESDPAWV